MLFELTDRQRRARDLAKEAAEEFAPGAADRDARAAFPVNELALLADAGLMGVNVPVDLGGLGAGFVAYSLAVTEVSAVDPAIAVTMCVNNMVAEVITQFASEKHRESIVPQLQTGAFNSGSFCLSEPGAGSDPQGMTTRARRVDGGWEISGSKAWITSGAHAGVYVVWAKTDERISAFLVDPTADGVSFGKPEEKMGQHASNTVPVSFDAVFTPDDALLGDVGDGFRIAMVALDGGRIGIASQALGIARSALHYGAQALARERYERLSAHFQAARLLTFRAASLKEAGQERFTREASMAKLRASDLAVRVCDVVIDALGVDAFEQGHPLERLRRDGRVTRIYEGTNEIQRIVIAREVLRRGVSGSTV